MTRIDSKWIVLAAVVALVGCDYAVQAGATGGGGESRPEMWGSSPCDGLVTSSPAPDTERPDPEALKDSLNGLLPDCFDCGMRVTTLEVAGDAAPYTLTIGIRFDPYTGEDVEERFTLTVDAPTFDIEAAAIEATGDLFGAHE